MNIMRKAGENSRWWQAKITVAGATQAAGKTTKVKIFFRKKGCLSVLLVYLHTLQPEEDATGEVGEWLKPVVC
jgi:hypothetical protein